MSHTNGGVLPVGWAGKPWTRVPAATGQDDPHLTDPPPTFTATRAAVPISVFAQKLRSTNTIYLACWPTNAGLQAFVEREIMAKKAIPADVQQRAVEVVEAVQPGGSRWRSHLLCSSLQRSIPLPGPAGCRCPGLICRLRYTGCFEKWEFAIFKYSSMTYDSHEWMFPGSQFIDGTIEGAMKAGMEAYPGQSVLLAEAKRE